MIDEAEYGVTGTISRNIAGVADLKFTPGASINPNQFVEDDPASSLFFQVGLQRENQVSRALDNQQRVLKIQDGVTPFVRYRVSAGFANAFETRSYVDQTLSAGFTFEDIRTYLCVNDEVPLQGPQLGCTGKGGLSYTLAPSLELVRSDDPDRERFTPRLKITVNYPVSRGYALRLELEGQARFYEHLNAPSGENREDMRLIATASIDVSGAVHDWLPWISRDTTFRLGLRGSQNWSNDDTQDYRRGYIVPSIGWEKAF
ncbi:MAG: hypothetical protein EON96_08715 [Caulobacteraceae bacterium]|nr:MAG: hypothetical protein EON96_08715 [Caulobacteraceae bacterium]